MLVFIDTEFTDFVRMDLISIALISEDGHEFYAERNDFRLEDCNHLVQQEIIPLLGKMAGATCSSSELTQRLRAWFNALPQAVTLLCDYHGDWELLAQALRGQEYEEYDSLPVAIEKQELLSSQILLDRAFRQAYAQAYRQTHLPRHHALADARALKAGYMAWWASQSV